MIKKGASFKIDSQTDWNENEGKNGERRKKWGEKKEMGREERKGMKTYTKSASIFEVNPPEVIFLVT